MCVCPHTLALWEDEGLHKAYLPLVCLCISKHLTAMAVCGLIKVVGCFFPLKVRCVIFGPLHAGIAKGDSLKWGYTSSWKEVPFSKKQKAHHFHGRL